MGHHRRSKKWAKKLAKRRQQERRRIERRAALVLDALRAPEDGPFTGIGMDPAVRALVQDGLLERAYHDALFPRLLRPAGKEGK